MNASALDRTPGVLLPGAGLAHDAGGGAVSWGAIFAGGVAAAALSLILVMLGVGLGFTAVSPWSQNGMSATGFGISSAIWLALTAIFASGTGGYIAGRLRARWSGTDVDEVHFRDTAHGLIAWAVATLVTAGVLTSALGSIVGGTAQAGAALTGAAATATAGAATAAAGSGSGGSEGSASGLGYLTDSLFRRDAGATPTDPAANAPVNGGEVSRIFVQSLRSGTLTPEDTKYLGQAVAQRTGLSQADAEKRVSDTFARAKSAADDAANKAKEAANSARKAGAYAALWIVVSLLLGAFSASFAATLGGRQRDA